MKEVWRMSKQLTGWTWEHSHLHRWLWCPKISPITVGDLIVEPPPAPNAIHPSFVSFHPPLWIFIHFSRDGWMKKGACCVGSDRTLVLGVAESRAVTVKLWEPKTKECPTAIAPKTRPKSCRSVVTGPRVCCGVTCDRPGLQLNVISNEFLFKQVLARDKPE